MFQSAPLTEARGDLQRVTPLTRSPSFQSAPLTEARGDLDTGNSVNIYVTVSIRSPHRSKGRPADGLVIDQRPLFQSAPLTEARGDNFCLGNALKYICFNPLPSPKQGET